MSCVLAHFPGCGSIELWSFQTKCWKQYNWIPGIREKKLFRTKCSTKTSIVWIFSSAISTKLIYQNILIDSYSELPTTFQINGVFSLWNSLLIRHIYWMLHVNFCIVQMSIAIINAFICRLFICCARIGLKRTHNSTTEGGFFCLLLKCICIQKESHTGN